MLKLYRMRIAIFHITNNQFGVDTTPLSYIMSSLEKIFADDIIYPICDIETLSETNPDIVCFYLKDTFLFNKLLDMSRNVKENINKETILFGEHITALPKTLPKNISVGIVGEAEETICNLIHLFKEDEFFDKNKLLKIKGIVFYDKDKLIITEKREYIKTLDDLQFTRKNFYGMPGFWIPTIVTGRGNCFKNIFTQFLDTPIRLHSYEWLMGNCVDILTYFPEIEYVEILDFLFLKDKNRFIEFSKVVKETNLSKYFKFIVNSFPKQLDDEILYLLKENLNILRLNIHLFSTSEKIQNDVKEEICNKEFILKILDNCQNLNLEVSLIFGLGSSVETQEEISKHYWFLEKKINLNYSNRINIYHKIYLPVPASESWIRLSKKINTDKISDFSLLDISNFNEKSLTLNNYVNNKDLIYIKDYLANKYENKNIKIKEENIIKIDNKIIHNLKEYISSDKLKEDFKKKHPNNYEAVFNEIKKAQNNFLRYGSYHVEDNNEYTYKDLSLHKKLKIMLDNDNFDFKEIDKYFYEINKLYYTNKINYFFYNKDFFSLPLLDIIEIVNKSSSYIKTILQISHNTYDISDLLDKNKFEFEYINNDLFNETKLKLPLGKKFDCIISIFTLNTCINDMRIIKYLYNILNKDGILIISIFNSKSIVNLRNILFNNNIEYMFNKKILNYISREQLLDLLIKNKFNVFDIRNINIPLNKDYLNIDLLIINFLKQTFNLNYDYNSFINTIVARKI
ncbi:MAG: hypothetical protein KatS3mg068_0642 [Candidatus Sericytochromatia bacterium]|nr:MAG: hypothetical protein KatS3mg068_0642 [Candidatus Sericytochromatia bacterium]